MSNGSCVRGLRVVSEHLGCEDCGRIRPVGQERKKKRFSVEQIAAVLQQAERGVPVGDVWRQVGIAGRPGLDPIAWISSERWIRCPQCPTTAGGHQNHADSPGATLVIELPAYDGELVGPWARGWRVPCRPASGPDRPDDGRA